MQKILILAAASLLSTVALAAGEVYRWKDSNGTWHYSDQPQPGAEMVRGARRAPTGTPGASPAPAAAPVPTGNPALPPVSQQVASQVRQEAATIQADQCKKAEEAYQNSLNARRIFKDDGKGNRTYLNSAEIDAARLEARSARDLACGP